MKLLLIIPPSPDNRQIVRMIDCSHESKANYLWQPNDFIIITSLLKPHDSVVLIDGTADSLAGGEFFEMCRHTNGDMLFFALSSVCWKSDYEYFRHIKQIFQDIPIYVIGDIFVEYAYQEMILKECDGIVFQPYQLNIEKMLERKGPLSGVYAESEEPPAGKLRKHITYVESFIPRHEIFLKSGYRFPFAKHLKFATVGHEGILGNENVDSKRLKILRRHAILKFYLRPSYIFRRLRKTSSLEYFFLSTRQKITTHPSPPLFSEKRGILIHPSSPSFFQREGAGG